ncbi:Uncharacterised protein [Legionella busanensis]|uniref:Coiled-coil protein n=1 Tax=Legionella busanensis TaxID=190655 RepID=A0A378JNU1_9GAMM|nr:hypothetical protein [Legionella busanensis]STX52348.1 Uncharacterised protein [Legionella busanensis]
MTNFYSEIKELLNQQVNLLKKEDLIKEVAQIEEAQGKDTLTIGKLQSFILKLYEIAEQQDYLNRKNAITPIQRINEIPQIYQAIKLLIDTAVDLKISELENITNQEELSKWMAFLPKSSYANITSLDELKKQ